MVEKELKKYTSSHEEGLRALARIIARAYMRDMREKTATGDSIQFQEKRKRKRAINNRKKDR
jgi:hypothetical protein